MAENRPHGRSRNVTGSGNVRKRGEGLGTGPVGNSSRPPSGGARSWQNRLVSSSCLQRWQVTDRGLVALNKNAGNASMTSAFTLQDFVSWGCQNYQIY